VFILIGKAIFSIELSKNNGQNDCANSLSVMLTPLI